MPRTPSQDGAASRPLPTQIKLREMWAGMGRRHREEYAAGRGGSGGRAKAPAGRAHRRKAPSGFSGFRAPRRPLPGTASPLEVSNRAAGQWVGAQFRGMSLHVACCMFEGGHSLDGRRMSTNYLDECIESNRGGQVKVTASAQEGENGLPTGRGDMIQWPAGLRGVAGGARGRRRSSAAARPSASRLVHLHAEAQLHGVAPRRLQLHARRAADGRHLRAACADDDALGRLGGHQDVHFDAHCRGW